MLHISTRWLLMMFKLSQKWKGKNKYSRTILHSIEWDIFLNIWTRCVFFKRVRILVLAHGWSAYIYRIVFTKPTVFFRDFCCIFSLSTFYCTEHPASPINSHNEEVVILGLANKLISLLLIGSLWANSNSPPLATYIP